MKNVQSVLYWIFCVFYEKNVTTFNVLKGDIAYF